MEIEIGEHKLTIPDPPLKRLSPEQLEEGLKEAINFRLVVVLRCLRCGYEWVPRLEGGRLPALCPRCSQPWFSKPAWKWDPWKLEKRRAEREGRLLKIPPLPEIKIPEIRKFEWDQDLEGDREGDGQGLPCPPQPSPGGVGDGDGWKVPRTRA